MRAMKLVEFPESPITCQNLIGGEWLPATTDEFQDVVSPYTNQVIARVPLSGSRDVANAVAKARVAAAGWAALPLKERTQTLFRFRELLHANLDELGNAAAIESGKTVAEGKAGLLKGIEVTEFALSLQNMDDGGIMEVSRGVTCEVRREPMGVVCGIAPFNFPGMVPMWMLPIAIAVGNAFILKPSEKVPLTACKLGELMVAAGFPPGLFSVVHGARAAVESLIDHEDVSVVGFVGSTAVARAVYSRAAALGKRALALGGAKNPVIVVPDADPVVTATGVVQSFTGCAGQRCMAVANLIAVGDTGHIIDDIVERARAMKLGPDMGAIIDRAALERLRAAIGHAKDEGAVIRLDGRDATPPAGFEGGNWLGPTIIDNARPDMECATVELFGPILTIVHVDTLEQAMELDRANHYGNAISVFTTRGAVARYVADHGGAGMIGINIGVPVPREPFSFAGAKESRFGHGDMTGRGGVELWSRLKKITTKWELQSDSNWMS